MSFADIINQEQKRLEASQGSGEKVAYPQTKHKRLFFEKNQNEILVQVLPAANLVSAFAEPIRKIFLSAKSSGGKDINSNFTLDPEPNEGSLLEQKVIEWASKGMIPNGFGGQQSPKRLFLVNVVKVIQNPANPQQWVQERDQQGNLVVRTFEMPQSAYANFLRKLGDPLLNAAGSEMSFMDPNRPAPVKISKPAKGQMEYPVEVYTMLQLPPLGQGWENQLEDLKAQAVPTERLENGYQWVQAFVDMKEGRKPNSGQGQEAPQANPYVANPYGAAPQTQVNPYAAAPQAPQVNPYAAAPQAQVNPYATAPQAQPQPTVNPYAAAPQVNPYAAAPQVDPYATAQPNPYASAPQPQVNPYAVHTAPNPIQTPVDIEIGVETDLSAHLPTEMAAMPNVNEAPQVPQYTAPPVPTQPAVAPTVPTHNVDVTNTGLLNIDAMLERELNGN